jgi:hypothetical protein
LPPKPVKRPVRGIFLALPAVFFTAWFAVADDIGGPGYADPGGPSNFDYLVLASMADSPQLHAMAGFRSSASRRDEPTPSSLKAEDSPR